MRYLKKYKIFEMAIIKPLDIGKLIDELIELQPRNIGQANEIAEHKYNVSIVTYDQFMDSIDDEMRAGAPPRDRFMFDPPPGMQRTPPSGMHFAVMNKFTNKMNLVVDYDPFLIFITRIAPPQLKKVIKSILGHESIHYQQFDKMGGDPDKYVVDSPIKNDGRDYLSHHTEIMAHAFSIVDELKNVSNKSKEGILQIIKKGRGHRILDDYRGKFWRKENLDKSKRPERDGRDMRVMRKLNKYMYQYVEELFGE
jgi:hypothetical protein